MWISGSLIFQKRWGHSKVLLSKLHNPASTLALAHVKIIWCYVCIVRLCWLGNNEVCSIETALNWVWCALLWIISSPDKIKNNQNIISRSTFNIKWWFPFQEDSEWSTLIAELQSHQPFLGSFTSGYREANQLITQCCSCLVTSLKVRSDSKVSQRLFTFRMFYAGLQVWQAIMVTNS